jgi:hypothetical protein
MSVIPDSTENGCETTFVEILDGEDYEAPSIGKFCSASLPPSFTSTGNALVIRLVSQYFAGYGFRAVYDHSSGGTHKYKSNISCVSMYKVKVLYF